MFSVLFLALESPSFAFLDMGLLSYALSCFELNSFYLLSYYLLCFSLVAEFTLTKQINVQFDTVTEFCCNFNVTYCGTLVS